MKTVTLKNLGNTCYFNSILQCFINSKKFQERIKKAKVIPIIHELQKLVNNIDLTNNEQYIHVLYDPSDLLAHFTNMFKRFQQHDAHEFLIHFLDILQEYSVDYHGSLKTTIKCTNCNNIISKSESFNTINLNTNSKDTLIDHFIEYLEKEEIEYKCEKCPCLKSYKKITLMAVSYTHLTLPTN